jgi:hypothetical protein
MHVRDNEHAYALASPYPAESPAPTGR